MSILDTFLILFETDADKARREMGEVRKEADKTADAMDRGVKHAKPLADGLGRAGREARGLGTSLKTAMGLIGAVGVLAVVNGITGALRQTVDEVARLGDASGQVRMTTQDFDTWRRAVKASGGDIAEAEQALAQYDKTLRSVQAGIGKDAVEALGALGLTATNADGSLKDVRTSLLEISGALEGMDRAAALRAVRRLGITDEGTITLLLKGRRAVEDLTAAQLSNGAVTQAQADKIKAYKDKTEELDAALLGIKLAIVSGVAPALTMFTGLLEKGARWIDANRDLVTGFGIAMGLAGAYILATYVPAMWTAAAATLAATWPVLAIGAAIVAVGAAFALAYEDVKAFMSGQPSLIGSLAERYEWFAAIVRGVGAAFNILKGVIALWVSDTVRSARAIGALFAFVFNGMKQVASDRIAQIIAVVQGVRAAFQTVVDFVSGIWSALFDNLGARVTGFGAALSRLPGLGGVGALIANGQGQLSAASSSPWASATSSSVQGARNSSRTTNVGPVNVTTRATDARGTGVAVQRSLTDVLRQAGGELDDGVAR